MPSTEAFPPAPRAYNQRRNELEEELNAMLDGYIPQPAAPDSGDVLTWDETAGQWKPTPLPAGGMADRLDATTVAGVDKTGATNSLTGLQNAITAAISAGHKRLYLPAGTYSLSGASGALLTISSDGVQLFGDGEGKTILKYADAQTLSADVTLIRLTGYRQRVANLSIDAGTGHTAGAFKISAISAYNGAVEPLVENIEIYNIFGGSTAGGEGIATYTPYNSTTLSTTLTAAIESTGSQAATPASMRGIYVGRRLTVTAEQVVVTAVTATTFTATFTSTHSAGATVTAFSQGFQRGVFRNITVRDSYTCSAFVVNSSGNTFENCRAVRIGGTVFQHGFYIQGGYNVFDKCHAEGCAGYNYHGWFQVANINAAGNVLTKCTSLNAGYGHVIMGGTIVSAANPEIPTSQYLNRYALIEGCTFRNTNGHKSDGLTLSLPCRVFGNVLEDIFPTTGAGWINDQSSTIAPCTIIANELRTTATTLPSGTNYNYILGRGLVEGNTITATSLTNAASGITVVAGATAKGNRVTLSGGRCMTFFGAGIGIQDNYLTTATDAVFHATAAFTDLIMTGNYMSTTGANLCNISLSGCSGRISGNNFAGGLFRYSNATNAVHLEGNDGAVSFGGNLTVDVPHGAGKLIAITADGTETARNAGRLVKYSGGKLLTVGTSDTDFAGVRVSAYSASDSVMYHIIGAGREALVECDEAWAQGNIAIPSTGTAGKVTDNGTTVPATSYGIFLDSGGAAGTARVLLMRTT